MLAFLPLLIFFAPAAGAPIAAEDEVNDAIEGDAVTGEDTPIEIDEGPIDAEGRPVPRLELVFADVGDDVYTLYGHVALLAIDDPEAPLREAELFNFGVTRFGSTDYVRDFLGGRVEFWGDARAYGRQLDRWKKEDRTVIRRPLGLSREVAARLIDQLRYDIDPVRRDYVYDTFRDNCSTRVRDYLDHYTGGAVYAAIGPMPTGRSFRDDVRVAYAGLPPLLAMCEVVPGPELDRARTVWELAYRPAMLVDGLGMVTTDEGPLLGETIVEYRRGGDDPRAGWIHVGQALVGVVAAVVLVLALVARRFGPRVRSALLVAWALGSSGLGVLLLVVGLYSAWPDMQRNALLVACPPTDLLLLFAAVTLWRRGAVDSPLARAYLMARGVTSALLLLATPLGGAFAGPLVPRLLTLVGLALAWRALGPRPAAEARPRRLVGSLTGRFPAASAARRQHEHTNSHLYSRVGAACMGRLVTKG
ncbi:MAG: DUF4105 domain-containing protein [bacterium]